MGWETARNSNFTKTKEFNKIKKNITAWVNSCLGNMHAVGIQRAKLEYFICQDLNRNYIKHGEPNKQEWLDVGMFKVMAMNAHSECGKHQSRIKRKTR